jgi:predicted dehydrogenase
MSQKVRWGILSTGRIAEALAYAMSHLEDVELVAVGSRNQEAADAFGDKFNIPHRHPTYEALANDPDIDAIYIATPHSHHYDNMHLCLNAGKHVLCEKAFTLNAKQAEACVALAQEKGLFLMEAMWTRFIPATVQARQWISEGVIGKVRRVYADLSANLAYNPEGRIYNPALGGGALLDVGVYPVSFSQMLLGEPSVIHAEAFIGETGVDEYEGMLFRYDDAGAVAHLSASVRFQGANEATILGEKGYIRFHAPFHHSQRLTLQLHGQAPQTHDIPSALNGYGYEVEECNRCIRAGKLESEVMPLRDTLTVMRLMDTLRERWGIRYAIAGEA